MSEALPACPLCARAPTAFHWRAARAMDFWRCSGCALIFRDPARWLHRDAELAYYRLHDNRPDDSGYRAFLKPLYAALLPNLTADAEGLDFGCGPASALAAMLEEAGHPMQRWDPMFAPDPAPLTRRYAFVTASEVIEHLHEPMRVFTELDELLAAGGWLGVLSGWPPQRTADFSNWHYQRDPTHVLFYGPETLAWIAQRVGWQLTLPARNVALFHKPAR